MDVAALVQSLTISALPIIFAITLHEAAHGYAARHFGDPTAWMLGRISANPLRHIDPIGTISPLALRVRRLAMSSTWSRKPPSACAITCQVRPNMLKSLT